ncbi:unnamed protein product [Didymodactylos carnosus]|uniref:SnoaL-like domain-containing protein n=1 Tax=Didymodactylos carnosus TaxID=1234261 RepID=A0A8S2D705_9BILA|nr:unnamed protein product [Didymodactylos carnosus]CAF3644932.1 unnamed protein product [Didymodactylos carnosus]
MDYSAAFALLDAYVNAIHSSKPEALNELFTADGTVNSPVCGIKPAKQFYYDWLKEIDSVRITVLNKFINPDNPHSIALHITLHLVKNNNAVDFPAVDVFELNGTLDKIKTLTILFDKSILAPRSKEQKLT